jgi:hypothetical protein
MKVKMLTIAAGPDPSQYHDAGTVVDLPRAKAKELIESGQAVAVDEKAETEAADEDAAEPRTPPEEQAGEFGKRAVTPETTTAKHAHAEETVKVDHKSKH